MWYKVIYYIWITDRPVTALTGYDWLNAKVNKHPSWLNWWQLDWRKWVSSSSLLPRRRRKHVCYILSRKKKNPICHCFFWNHYTKGVWSQSPTQYRLNVHHFLIFPFSCPTYEQSGVPFVNPFTPLFLFLCNYLPLPPVIMLDLRSFVNTLVKIIARNLEILVTNKSFHCLDTHFYLCCYIRNIG